MHEGFFVVLFFLNQGVGGACREIVYFYLRRELGRDAHLQRDGVGVLPDEQECLYAC